MTSIIRPTLILKMSLDQHVCSEEDLQGLKRAYSYIAPVLAQELPECSEEEAHNILTFVIKLRNPYWDANDAECNEQWDAVMPKWLHNMFYKVFSTVTAANTQFKEHGELTMPYKWLELDFEDNALIAIKTDADSNVDGDAALELVEKIRQLYAQGVFDSNVACVRVPSAASYEQQLEAAREAQAAAEAAAAATAEEEVTAEAADEVAASTEQKPAVEGVDAAAADGEEPAEEVEPVEPAFAWPEDPAFDIDISTWGIEYADGTAREFDAAAGAFKE